MEDSMKLSEIRIGTRLELEVYNNLGEKVRPSLISQMEGVNDEYTAYIATPIVEGTIYPLHIGTEMDVCFFSKDNLYKFRAAVMSRGYRENIALLKIERRSDIQRFQRRQFYRFQCSVPVKFRVVDALNLKQDDDAPFKEVITRDISGGGLSLAVEEKLELGNVLECELPISEKRKVRFWGKVVKVAKLDLEGSKYKYEIGVSFRKIENRDVEAIIGFIFKEQSRLRRKGLI